MTKRKLKNEEILSLPELYMSGLSSLALAKKFNTDRSNILHHLKKLNCKIRNKSSAAIEGVKAGRIIIKKNRIPRNLILNKDLAYILGVLAGDGYIDYSDKRRCYQMGLSATDKEFVENFNIVLSNFFKIKPTKEFKKSKVKRWNNQYITRLCSKEACDFIRSLGDFGKYNWRVPKIIKNSPTTIQFSFIKGFSDSESDIDRRSGRIGLTSVNLEGLKEVSDLLNRAGIRTKIISQRVPRGNRLIKNVLRIQDRRSLELFNKDIGFTIFRKQKILCKHLKTFKFYKILTEDLNKLKPRIIKLRKDGLSYNQISHRLGLNLTTVWNTCNNIKEATMFPRDRDRLTP